MKSFPDTPCLNHTGFPGGNVFVLPLLERKSGLLLVCIPVCIMLAMAIPFSVRSYWDDEFFSIMSAGSWGDLLNVFRKYENNMALYYVILYLWMNVFGDGEFATRMLSLLFSGLTIFYFFALARRFFNKTTSFFACLLLASNPLFLFYALETRSYSLLLLFAVVSTLVFIDLLRKPEVWRWALYGILISAAVYTHYFGILLIPVHAVALLSHPLSRKLIIHFFISIVAVLTLISPLLLFPPQSTEQVNWMPAPPFRFFISTVILLFGGKYIFLGLLVCLFFVFRYWNLKRLKSIETIFLPVLSLSWAAIPVCLIFLISVLVKPIFLERYFIWCLPGFIFFACMIISNLSASRVTRSIIFTLPVIMLLVQSYHKLMTKGSGYKEAALFLSKEMNPGEAVISYPFFKAAHYSFYLSKISGVTSFNLPKGITSEDFLPGGGGRDPDPDPEMIEEISKSALKVYVICRLGNREADGRQNRTWLPAIEKLLLKTHPRKKEFIFGEDLTAPVRLLVFD